MPDIIGWFFNFIIMGIITVFIVNVASVGYQFNERSDYKMYVNMSIERHGGLTEAALNDIENYSTNHYKGRFKMNTEPSSVAFGSPVEYEYTLEVKPAFFDISIYDYKGKGIASSKVGNSN